MILLLFALLSVTKSTTCDPSLARHVYKPARLHVLQSCLTVTGTIVDATHGKRKDGVRHEKDGDTHGWLDLDPAWRHLLLPGNLSQEGGNLVYEVVCAFPVRQADAKAACRGYSSAVTLAPVGAHVAITGVYVQDQNHARWAELHPVSRIEILP